jgi:diadenosine tetraphosphatase ApaH/serine/threonine PP2A family protein phosphatase
VISESIPALSVILPTPDEFETIRRTVAALRAQTIWDRLELVIVAPTDSISVDPAAVAGFAGVQVLAVGRITSTNAARVAGIRVARAPIVALAEDHCFPEPEWAASLLAAHGIGCAAVGPALRNGNPRTAVSWANYLAEYGRWVGQAAGEIEQLPGHNSSYRRELLLEYGGDLVQLMEAESVMQEMLRQRGERLLFEPAARANHYSFSLWRSSVRLRFHSGRLFAGHRVRAWNRSRRLMYIVGSPLIPLVRLRRILRVVGRADSCRVPLGRLAPVLLLLLSIDAAGELVGYLTGPGSAGAVLASIEFHREHRMTSADRRVYQTVRAQPSIGSPDPALPV